MSIEKGIFRRTSRLIGDEGLDRLGQLRVIIFGVGGVGSWCAESLVRTGIRYLTIVDSDRVCITNVNRQLMATTKTIGRPKVEVLRERLLDINPSAEITALMQVYSPENADSYHLEQYDYIVDAIDSLECKCHLILTACTLPGTLVSSMGAALKMDPTRIQVAEFWKVQGCPLARAIRNRFKRFKTFPAKKFQCVFSDELVPNLGPERTCGTEECVCAQEHHTDPNDWHAKKVAVNGTVCHTTAIFGMTLAGIIIQKEMTSK